jgi:hypothetical protein
MDVTAAVLGILYIVSLAGSYAFLIYAWIRWGRKPEKFAPPLWRYISAFCACTLTTLSALYFAGLFAYQFFRILRSYDPLVLFGIRWGGLCAVLGLLLSITGKGRLRITTLVASIMQLFLWFATAAQQ